MMTDSSERELELRSRELDLREREVDLAARRARSDRWRNPLTVAVIAAALAGFSNLWLAYENNNAQLRLERTRAESERILETLKAGDPARARENLRFLLQLGLVRDEELRRRIEAWEANPNRSPIYLQAQTSGGRVAIDPRAGSNASPRDQNLPVRSGY